MESWLHIENLSGSGDATRQVTADENRSDSVRTATIKITSDGGAEDSVSVSQEAGVKTYAAPVVTVTYPDVPASGGGSTPTVQVTQTWGWNGNTMNGGTLKWNSIEDLPEDSTTIFSSANLKGTVNSSTGVVTGVASCGTAERNRTSLGQIRYVFTVNGKQSGVMSGNAAVYQEENKIEETVPVSFHAFNTTLASFTDAGSGNFTGKNAITAYAAVVKKSSDTAIVGPYTDYTLTLKNTYTSGSTSNESIEEGLTFEDNGSIDTESTAGSILALTVNSAIRTQSKPVTIKYRNSDAYPEAHIVVTVSQQAPNFYLKKSDESNYDRFSSGSISINYPSDGENRRYGLYVDARVGTSLSVVKKALLYEGDSNDPWIDTPTYSRGNITMNVPSWSGTLDREGSVTLVNREPSSSAGTFISNLTVNVTQEKLSDRTVTVKAPNLGITIANNNQNFIGNPFLTFRFRDEEGQYYTATFDYFNVEEGGTVKYPQVTTQTMSVPGNVKLRLEIVYFDFTDHSVSNVVELDPSITINCYGGTTTSGTRMGSINVTQGLENFDPSIQQNYTPASPGTYSDSNDILIQGSINLDVIQIG